MPHFPNMRMSVRRGLLPGYAEMQRVRPFCIIVRGLVGGYACLASLDVDVAVANRKLSIPSAGAYTADLEMENDTKRVIYMSRGL